MLKTHAWGVCWQGHACTHTGAGPLAGDCRHTRKQSLQRARERAPRGQAVRAVKAGLRRVHARDQRVQRRAHRAALAGRRQRLQRLRGRRSQLCVLCSAPTASWRASGCVLTLRPCPTAPLRAGGLRSL